MPKYLTTLKSQRSALLAKYRFVFERPSPEDLRQWQSPVHVPANVLIQLGKIDARISLAERGRSHGWLAYAMQYNFRPRGISLATLSKWCAK